MPRMTRRPPGQGRRTGRRRQAALLVLLVSATVVAVVTGRGDGTAQATQVAFDRDSGALTFELEGFDGRTVSSADLAGTPLVLNGYASWCTLCLREMPDFERVHRAAGDRVALVGFNPQSSDRDDAQARMVRETGVTYPTVRDPDDRLLRQFNPTGGLPITLFIDADGIVRKVHRGLLTEQTLPDEIRGVLGVDL